MKTRTIFDASGAAVAGLFQISAELGGPVAQRFESGAEATFLHTLQLDLGDFTPEDGGSITVRLCADEGGVPGRAIATLGTIQNAALTPMGGFYDLAIGKSPLLAANTGYWIELTTTDAKSGAYWLVAEDAAVTGAAARTLHTGKGVQAGKEFRMILGGGTDAVAADSLAQHTDDLLPAPDLAAAAPLGEPRDGGSATTIFDDSGSSHDGIYVVATNSASGDGPLGQSFFTGASAITLTDLQLELVKTLSASGTITVGLYTDSGSGPGTLVETLGTIADSALPTQDGTNFYDFAISDSLTLNPGTTYWIELSSNETSPDAVWGFSTEPTGIGVTRESLYADGDVTSTSNFLMTLSGDPVLFDDSGSPHDSVSYVANSVTASGDGPLGQSFVTGGSAITLTDLKLDLYVPGSLPFNERDSGGGTITVGLYTDSGNGPGGLIETLGTIAVSALPTQDVGGFYDFAISDSPTLASGTTYWIELSSNETAPGAVWEATGEPTGVGVTGESLYVDSQVLTGFDYLMTLSGESVCFAAGTRILTSRGEIPVENLRPGDLAFALRSGRLTPVRWIGRRHLDLRNQPNPDNVNPVRVRAQAFGENLPHADLVLSPNHALYVDGSLIAVRYLLNGATIVQEARDEIDYYHVELDTHDVLLANGLAAESFLDVGNRGNFADGGGVLALHPDFAAETWAEKSCAPALEKGKPLETLRLALLARAHALGHVTTTDATLRVVAHGRVIWPVEDGLGLRFDLPADTRSVRLVSRSARPSDMRAAPADGRLLGVGVVALALDGAEMPLDHPCLTMGWHEAEPGLRWTDGDACLLTGGARRLSLRLHGDIAYWAAPDLAGPAAVMTMKSA